MSNLKMKPEFNDLPEDQASAGGGHGSYSDPDEAGDAGALLRNPLGGRRLRLAGHAPRLAPPSDDGFHMFRVY
jgi:hypothetical protein